MSDTHQTSGQTENRPERAGAKDVSGRLHLAFGGIVLLTVVTSALAIYSFNQFANVVNTTTTETIPLIISAGRLSGRSQSLAASAPNIALARDDAELRATMDSLDSQLAGISEAFDELEGYRNPEPLAHIRQDVENLSDILANLETLSISRIALRHSRQEFIATLQNVRADFNDAIVPVTYGVRSLMNLFANRANRRSARTILQLNEKMDDVDKEQRKILLAEVAKNVGTENSRLIDRSLKDGTVGAEIRGFGNDMFDLLNSVLLQESTDFVLQLRSHFDRSFNEFRNSLNDFERSALAERNPVLVGNLKRIGDNIGYLRTAGNNPFNLRMRELELFQETEKYLAMGRQASARMSEDLALFVAGVADGVSSLNLATDEKRDTNSTYIVAGSAISLLAIVIIALATTQALRRREVDLTAARESAESANRAKSEFLSSMSHELRTPMNAILGFTQMLEYNPKEPLTSDQKICVDQISGGGRHLLQLIDEVLDLAKIESGTLPLSHERVQLADLCGECLGLVEKQADQRGLAVKSDMEYSGDVEADRTRLKQVLLNLLSNAVKYNRNGGTVTLACGKTAAGRIRVSVSDTGDGVKESDRRRLFEPFERLGKETGEIEGTGIGLTITRQLIEAMGGRIGVESKVGEGSTFWVEIAEASADTDVSSPVEISHQETSICQFSGGATILYIEDNPANLKLMETIIGRMAGLVLISSHNAEIGVKLAVERKPDLILMDINLPGMDGIAAKRILDTIDATRDIPVIGVSAAAMKDDIDRGMAAGFKAYLSKPFNLRELVAAIEKELGD